MTVMAMGARSSAPSPPKNAIGISPSIVANAVISIGLILALLAAKAASLTFIPFDTYRFIQSINTTVWATSIPPSIPTPISTYALTLVWVIKSPIATPISDKGMLNITTKGCHRDSNSAAIII